MMEMKLLFHFLLTCSYLLMFCVVNYWYVLLTSPGSGQAKPPLTGLIGAWGLACKFPGPEPLWVRPKPQLSGQAGLGKHCYQLTDTPDWECTGTLFDTLDRTSQSGTWLEVAGDCPACPILSSSVQLRVSLLM